MITITNVRNNGVESDPIVRDEDQISAFSRFAIHEIGFGGRVEQVEEFDDTTLIRVRVVVMGCVDITTFEGTSDEMAPFITFMSMV